jgi:hypothetical protein
MGWGSIKKSLKKAFKDTTKFVWKGAKQVTAFQLNMYTLGAANKFTSISKWGGTQTAGKAGAAVGITGAALVGGAYVAGAFAPVTAAGAEAVAGSGAAIASGAETSVEAYAAYDAALAAGAAEGVGSVAGTSAVAGSAIVPVAAGAGSSILGSLGSTSTLLGAGLLSSLFGSLKTVGAGALTSLVEREGKDIFGGTNTSTTIPGSSSGSGASWSATLPYILIALTILGAIILTRKKGRK